jgi:hypothetical protein
MKLQVIMVDQVVQISPEDPNSRTGWGVQAGFSGYSMRLNRRGKLCDFGAANMQHSYWPIG